MIPVDVLRLFANGRTYCFTLKHQWLTHMSLASPPWLLHVSQFVRTASAPPYSPPSLISWNRRWSHASSSAVPRSSGAACSVEFSPGFHTLIWVYQRQCPKFPRGEGGRNGRRRVWHRSISPNDSDSGYPVQPPEEQDTATTRHQIVCPYWGLVHHLGPNDALV